jgi:hypothetical protein
MVLAETRPDYFLPSFVVLMTVASTGSVAIRGSGTVSTAKRNRRADTPAFGHGVYYRAEKMGGWRQNPE